MHLLPSTVDRKPKRGFLWPPRNSVTEQRLDAKVVIIVLRAVAELADVGEEYRNGFDLLHNTDQ